MLSTASEAIGVKHIKGYNWKFDRVNSKGEVIFKHYTEESLEDVKKYLTKKNIYFEETKTKMLRIFYNDNMYSYYYTTGRWAKYMPKTSGYPKEHYHSKNIHDFFTRFLQSNSNETH